VTALLLKDLRLLRPWWWIIVPIHVLFAANGVLSPETFFAINVVLALALTVALLIVEWQQEADRFVASLPVSRGQVVRARYAWILGVALGGTVLYAVYGSVLLALGTDRILARWPGPPGWESVAGLVTFFATVWLVSVAYLPFYYRAGLGKGTWWFVVCALPLVGIAVPLMRSPYGTPEMLETPGSVAAVLALSALAGWLSEKLSARFYEGRDL
jgi:hypothetical protein